MLIENLGALLEAAKELEKETTNEIAADHQIYIIAVVNNREAALKQLPRTFKDIGLFRRKENGSSTVYDFVELGTVPIFKKQKYNKVVIYDNGFHDIDALVAQFNVEKPKPKEEKREEIKVVLDTTIPVFDSRPYRKKGR